MQGRRMLAHDFRMRPTPKADLPLTSFQILMTSIRRLRRWQADLI
jgi:hypothetical protein